MARSRTALCIVRTWMEEGSTVLRAEISVTTDASNAPRRSVVVTGAQDVERLVRAWLLEAAAGSEPPLDNLP